MEFATQPRFTCAVRWHQAAFEDQLYPRDMRRTTVYDTIR